MITFLTQLGISSKASEIYLFTLQNGESAVTQIAKAVGLNRTAVYPYITELENLKLIKWSERSQGNAIQASNPSTLEKLIKSKENNVIKLKKKFESSLPNLKAMYKVVDEQYIIERFTGVKAIREILQIVYKSKIQYGYCGEFLYESLGKQWYEEHLYQMYKVHKIKDHVIFPKNIINKNTYTNLLKTKWFDKELSEYRYSEDLVLNTNIDTYILEDCVLTIYNEPKTTCIVNRSKQYRDYQLGLFMAIWKKSLRMNKLTNEPLDKLEVNPSTGSG